MKLLYRYIIRSHVAPFFFGVITVMFIFLMQFLMNFLDKFVGKGLSEWVIIQLISYNLAWMVILAVPMGVLFSTIMAFGGMSQAHEITIIKASGGSLFRMMFPLMIMGLLLSAALFYFNDKVLPEANYRAKVMMNDITRKKPTFNLASGQFSTQLEGYTILARKVDSISGLLIGVTIYDNTNIDMKNIISADTGSVKFSGDFKKLVIDLKHGEIHQFFTNFVNNYKVIKYDKSQILINAFGFAFEQSTPDMVSRGDRELSVGDMNKIVKTALLSADSIRKQSSDLLKNNSLLVGIENPKPEMPNFNNPNVDTSRVVAVSRISHKLQMMAMDLGTNVAMQEQMINRAKQYDVEVYKKYAIPFACFIFIFIGCPLGIITKGGNFGLSAGFSLLFYIIYWACLISGEKLADRGLLAPWLSMWLGNIVIGLIGLALTIKVNYESFSFVNPRSWFRK